MRVLGVDGAYVRGMGKTNPALISVDLGIGKSVEIGYVFERDPQAVREWLEPIVKHLGVTVIGKSKICSKPIRGFIPEQVMLNALMLAASGLWWFCYRCC